MARLRVVSGPAAGQTVDIEGEIVIGREDTDLAIDDGEMSRRHAVVRRHANRLQVEDLGSTNGTFVDGTRIAEPTLLGGGAEIKVGTTVLVVEGVLPVSEAGGDVAAPRNVTRISPVISDAGTAPANAASSVPIPLTAPAAAAPAAPPLAAPTQAVGEFRPPERSRKQPGLASRSWVPVALSFGTVIIVAVALVIYFSQHT
ncbi:MAG TPA: FHA domain-containing protein [Solirubrobacteraceae bacterium]|jgi:pSer/pThr/pTyr-binding forkhead associated (FHA) protein